MAKNLSYFPLQNFGVNGLNLQDNPSTLDTTYLTKASNIVIRESGRISLRKGLKQKVVPNTESGGTAIASITEHKDQGTNKIFASFGTSIYTVDFTTPNAAFPSSGVDVKHTVSGSSGNWQFVNFNKRLHCFHAGIVPQRYDGASDAGEKWSTHYNATAINLANGSSITAPNVVSGSSYKITALGNTNFELLGADSTPAVNEIFTATSAGGDGIASAAITAPNIVAGKAYKIITTGNTNFTLVGAADSNVDTIFTANSTSGLGTGTVKEVVSTTTGTIVEIKTNPSLTTITVDSTTGFPPNGKIIIDSEIISYTGITPTTFTGCTRGADSTSAVYHDDNDAVTTATKPASITTFDPSCGMGFYGRLWCGGVTEEKDVVFYSSLLDGDDWTGGSAAAIDLKSVWGTDDIVAIAPFYGKLVIFGKNNIAIYDSPQNVQNLALNEVIRGIGCVSRDSVQAIGDDLVFLSATGLRSLSRTSELDKLPLTDLSYAIKDTLIRNIGQSTNVKSVYVENEGIYIMSFIDENINYVFDFKHMTPRDTPRITTWVFSENREPASMTYTETYGYLTGQKDGGIAGYEGYNDVDLAWVSNAASYTNASYTSDILSPWIPLGQSVSSVLLKRIIMVLEGGSGATLGLKWYKDFRATPSSTVNIDLRPTSTGSTALWGASTSLFGTSKFTPIYGLQEYKSPLTGSAKHIKLNISVVSNGYDASIQDLTLLTKEGKIR